MHKSNTIPLGFCFEKLLTIRLLGRFVKYEYLHPPSCFSFVRRRLVATHLLLSF